MLLVCLPIHVEGELNQGAKAVLALPQRLFVALALADVTHQGQVPTFASAVLKLDSADLHREDRPILAPMAGLEG